MRKECIYKVEDGRRYRITVDFSTESFGDKVAWNVDVAVCDPGKRKFVPLVDTMDDYRYRSQNVRERKAYKMNIYLEHVPISWIRAVQEELVRDIEATIPQLTV